MDHSMDASAQVTLIIVLGLLAFCFFFKDEVRAKLRGLKKATFPGGSLDMSDEDAAKQVEAQKEPTKDPAQAALPVPQPTAGALAPPVFSPLYAPLEESFRQRIEEIAPGAVDLQMAWALRVAAAATVEKNHEQIYRVIFGSQILALKETNIRGHITVGQARTIYDMAVEAFPHIYEHYSFEAWGDFVLNNGLATGVGDEPSEDARVVLTHAGKDFLMWLTAKGMPENKGG